MNQELRSLWKLRLVALGLGILTLLIVFAIALKFSNDLRLIHANGLILLFCGAAWLGWKKEDWFAGMLLIAPLAAIFSYEVLANIPALWPGVVLWFVAGAAGLVFVRAFRKQTAVAIAYVTPPSAFARSWKGDASQCHLPSMWEEKHTTLWA